MTTILAQDPFELFDTLTEEGAPTGITKTRRDVHRDGDWHQAVHVWVYGWSNDGPYVLLNQRGRHKDTWPLALDATVGGHLGAGETVEDAFREVHEEIGIHADPARFEFLFTRKRSSNDLIPGIRDNEFQQCYLLRDDRPLTAYAPNAAELEGLVQVSLPAAVAQFSGETQEADGLVLSAATGTITPHELTADQLLVRGADRYFIDVVEAIASRLA